MNYNLRLLLTGLASGTALATLTVAFRRWQRTARADQAERDAAIIGRPRTHGPGVDEREPVLGYDGMDADTLIDWLERTNLDRDTLRRVRTYERRHQGRQDVLAVIDDLLD